MATLTFALTSQFVVAQEVQIKSGPMVAYSTMKEVLIWVQTTEDASVKVHYWPSGKPQDGHHSEPVHTNRDGSFIAHCIADSLEPGIKYDYAVILDGQLVELPYECSFKTQDIWKWRGDAPDFSFAAGSCLYVNQPKYDRPGTPYGAHYEILNSIDSVQPDFFLWLGDNTYLREADWNSKTGIDLRYEHTRSLKELKPLLARTPNYAIWDDHDFGPNNSDRSYPLKQHASETFRSYFPAPNRVFDQGVTHFVQWADCDFFMLDNRYWRSPNRRSDLDNPTILGDEQIQWLIDALANSRAPFKFVVMGGQFLTTSAHGEHYINVAPDERDYLIEKLHDLQIEGVIFLSGDVHFSEMSTLHRDGAYPIYEFTASPLTSGVHKGDKSENTLQDPQTVSEQRNFMKFEISGSYRERKLTARCFSSAGKMLWTRTIEAKDLRY